MSTRYHIIRDIPSGFHVIRKDHLWVHSDGWRRDGKDGKWYKDGTKFGTVGVLLQSDDMRCELLYDYISGNPLYDAPDIGTSSGFFLHHNLKHRNTIMFELLGILNGKDDFRFEDYVTIVSGNKAKRYFNADSVFTFDVPIEPLNQDGAIYTHCVRMFLSRKDRAALGFVWFFTDEGFARKEYYMDKLRKNVWYKD